MGLFSEIMNTVRISFSNHIIFSVGLLLIMGYIFGQFAEKIKLPAITGYIISGIIVGSSGLEFIHADTSESLHILSEVTLSFIAVVIGGEFSFYKLKIYGKKIVLLTLFQLLAAFTAISGGLYFMGLPVYTCFILGAIGAATAPAATVVIVEKLKAKGTFVDYLYGIVALDDAGTVILFSIVFALSSSMITGVEAELSHSLLHAFSEIFYSIVIGLISGFLIHFSTIRKKSRNEIKIISLGIIFLATSVSISLKVSPLITNMTIGTVLINMNKKNIRILKALEPLTPPLYAVFFAIAGTELDFSIFKDVSVLAGSIVYIAARGFGKYAGIFVPSYFMKLPKEVKKYLGLALIPQAGVAIGLVLFVQASPIIAGASESVKSEIIKMVNIILLSVFCNEMLGPPLAKFAIIKSLKRRR